ncbi:MAG: extracellular solute-binding protein [Clostridia bacterium]|nr:extracellular solute-binding protein [Clostridia bacterium]
MYKKSWLRLAILGLAAVLLLSLSAGCGTKPDVSDPDQSDLTDVSDEPSIPDITDSADTSTVPTGDAGSSDVPTTDETDATDTTPSSTRGTSVTKPTTTGGGASRSTLTTTTTKSKTSATTTTKSKTSATTTTGKTSATATTTKTDSTNPLANEDVDSTDEAIDRDKFYQQNKNIAMPVRDLENKEVTIFSWRDQQSDGCYGATKPDLRKVYKDVGITTKWYQANFENYMDALSAVVASGSSPDLLEWDPSGSTYPAAIASGLVVPLDPYINWDDDIWDDVRALTAKYQINNSTYFSFEYMQIAELLYYDPTIIRAAGLETPLELWRKGTWDLKALQNIADKTVQIDKDGTVTRIGFIPGDIGMITGLELVEYNRAKSYKLNIANSKYKTLMNTMYQMGVNGTQSAGFDYHSNVGKGSAVMSMTAGWAMTNEMNAAREKGKLEWCILPKLDNKSDHYYNLTLQQTFGLIKGAKNPEGAAYLVELRKWAFLNYPWLETLPFTDTAYTRKYGEKAAGLTDEGVLTSAELKYTQDLLNQDYAVVAANLWGGWLSNSQFPGITEVISNGNQWSTVLANKRTTLEAILKHWKFK